MLVENAQVTEKAQQKGKATTKGAASDCFTRLSPSSARPRCAQRAEGLRLLQVRNRPPFSVVEGKVKNHPNSVNRWMQLQT